MKFGQVAVEHAVGLVLAHAVFLPYRKLAKGTIISDADIREMADAGLTSVTAAQLELGDIDEDGAAARIAHALLGSEIRVEVAATGRCNLFSLANGIFQVDADAIDAANAVDEAVTIATLPNFRLVYAGEMVATVKIIPYAVSGAVLATVEARLQQERSIRVAKFRPHRVAVISTVLPRLKPSVVNKAVRNLDSRLRVANSVISSDIRVQHDTASLAAAIKEQAAGADLIVVFGASATSDRFDVIPSAIEAAGGMVERLGMPVDPGNLLVLGRIRDKPVIGAPGCARSPRENGFDWVLNRLLADISVSKGDVHRMGVGGLLMEIPSRPQKRSAATPAVAAVVLAAGRGSRMGGQKMLVPIDGRPMIAHVVDMVLASSLRPVIVVTGRDGKTIRQAIGDQDVHFVVNEDVALGLSHSLALGLGAVPENCAGATVILGDMPAVRPDTLDALLSEAAVSPDCKAIVPTFAGQRGNPVLLLRRLFDAALELEGDKGARVLLTDIGVIELPVDDPGILLDIDTEDARRAFESGAAKSG